MVRPTPRLRLSDEPSHASLSPSRQWSSTRAAVETRDGRRHEDSIAVAGMLVAVIVATPALSTPGSGVTAPVLGRGVLEGPEKLKIRSDRSGRRRPTAQHRSGWPHRLAQPSRARGRPRTAGELTLYMADDKKCRPHTYAAGEAFIDRGRGNVHIARNEGAIAVGLHATYLDVPADGAFRIDHPDPGNCTF